MTTTNDVIEPASALNRLSWMHAPLCGALIASNFLFRGQFARVFLEHHRDAVADRVSESARAADQFRLILFVNKRALACGADQYVQ